MKKNIATTIKPLAICSIVLIAVSCSKQSESGNYNFTQRQEEPTKVPVKNAEIIARGDDTDISSKSLNISNANEVYVKDCTVGLTKDVLVPSEDTGVLKLIGYKDEKTNSVYRIKEQALVKKGDIIAMLGDEKARMSVRAAKIALAKMKKDAANDINILFAKASAGVAKFEHQAAVEANEAVPGSVADVDVKRLKLSWERAKFEVMQAEFTKEQMGFDILTEEVKLKAAEDDLRRRTIRSPIDGMIIKVMSNEGEWVEAGTPVFRIIEVDRIRVRGYVSFDKYHPKDIREKTAEVTVTHTGGKKVTVKGGKVTFVSPLLSGGDEYQVWAEFDNREHYHLRPGMQAEMKIILK